MPLGRAKEGFAFITTFHDLRFPYLFPKAGAIRPWIVRHLARSSAGVIVTNRGDEATLGQEVNPRYMARIPLGATVSIFPADEQKVAQIRASIGEGFIIGHFGFVNAVKGVDSLIQAVKLAQAKGLIIHLLMMGERLGSSDPTNQAYLAQVETLAAELGVALHWTGHLEEADLGHYFAACDVIALPFKDGASLRRTSLQAGLAYGCSIITTHPQDDPLPEFTDGESLLYVPADDPPALAEAIQRLAEDEPLREKLRAGAKSASQGFAWGTLTRQIVAFYQQVLHP